MEQDVRSILLNLKNGMTREVPEVWAAIRRRIARQVADELLEELKGVPSPRGRLTSEIRQEVMDKMRKGA